MGCDGGTIPRRDELVRQKPKPEQVDKDAQKIARWKYCASSQEELKEPVVGCSLGKMYNKEIILTHLINKQSIPNAPHIKSLKHVKELKLTLNPAFENNTDASTSAKKVSDDHIMFTKGISTEFIPHYICPILQIEMNGIHKFSFIFKCGCVISEKALKEIKESRCPNCNQTYDKDLDLIPLYSDDEKEIEQLKERMLQRFETTKKVNGNTSVSSKRKDISDAIPTNDLYKKNKTMVNACGIVHAAVIESKKKLGKEEIFATETYKSIFASSSK